jgi:hypothetical protein
MGGGATTMAIATLSAYLWSETVITDCSTDPWYLKDSALFTQAGSCMLYEIWSWNEWVAACQRSGWWMSNCYCAQNWKWAELTWSCQLSLPLEVASLQ